MKLLLDIGNSRLKWGLLGNTGWVAQGAIEHDAPWDFEAILPPPGRLSASAGVNVAGEALAERADRALAPWGCKIQWIRPSAACAGVRNAYDPAQLGADRWAAVLGASRRHAGAALVVTAGTATTIDVLSDQRVFLGGLIIPGVDLMKRALAGNTAQLPLADGVPADIPTRTVDAIHMGCLQAQAGAIERMYRRLAGQAHPVCLLGGGAGPLIAPMLDLPVVLADNLVLDGVAVATGEPGFL